MSGPTLIKTQQLAKLLGLTERRINQLSLEDGILFRAGRGQFELIRSIQGYVAHLKQQIDGRGDSIDAAREKSRCLRYQADLAEIELKAKRGELVPMADVMDEVEKTFTALRQRMLAVPTKAAPLVFGLRTLAEIKKILDDEIHETLIELSTGRYRGGDKKSKKKISSPASKTNGDGMGEQKPDVEPGDVR